MSVTKFSEAFAQAGIHPRDVEIDIANAKYLNSGGTIEGLQARLDVAAARMPGMGHDNSAGGSSQRNDAQTRQPVEDEGAVRVVPQGQFASAPSSSSDRGGEGHSGRAQPSQSGNALPVRGPKPQRAPIDFGTAALAIKNRLAQSVLDRATTSDGRAWGDVGAHELDGMIRDGALAKPLKDHIGQLSNSQRFMTIRELVNPETFEAIRSQVYGA